MLINKEERIEAYELKIEKPYRIKEIMCEFAFAGKPEHRIHLGERMEEKSFFEITGTESTLIKNLLLTDTGKRDWTGGFYNEYSYQVYINEYDEYKCPEIYNILGVLLTDRVVSEENTLKMLSRLSRMCELKKIPLKRIFDQHIEELLSLIILERKETEYIRKLNRLYEILYLEHHEDIVFPKQEFMQKYKVYKYDLKNIKKV